MSSNVELDSNIQTKRFAVSDEDEISPEPYIIVGT